jgi:HlyD family secretion protein
MKIFKGFPGKIIKGRKKMIWIIIFTVIFAGAIFMYRAGEVLEVKTVPAVRGSIRDVVEQTGEVETVKKQEIYALYGGRLKKVPVEVGQRVAKGQTLVEFDLEDLNIRLEQAEAQLMQAQESAPLSAQVAAASAALEQAALNRDRAREEAERISVLYEEGAVSESEYQQAVDVYQLAEAQLNSAIAALEAAREGETAQQAAIASARAEVLLIRRQIEEGRVNAVIEGTVLEKYLEEGMIAAPGSRIMKVGDLSSLQVKCMFLASQAVDIKEGDEVIIKGDVLKDDVIEGRVKKVFPQAIKVVSQLGIEQQRVPVEIEMFGSHENLKPGFNVDVEVITEEVKDVVMVPKDAVFEMDDNDYVFTINGGKAELREIVKGVDNKDWVQVVEGLEENEKVILDPPNNLSDGARVREK